MHDRSDLLTDASRADVSVGFVINEVDPARAVAICDSVTKSAPTNARVEFLVLDDHTNPSRRELVGLVDQHGDSVRLVPRPRPAGCVELDAVSQSSASEFLVLSFGEDVPWDSLGAALGELWADGADVVAVGGIDTAGLPERCATGDEADELLQLARWLGLGGGTFGDTERNPGRLVLIRRWVARWLFSEVPRETDPAMELTDRAHLLGLRMLVLDSRGMPI